MQPALDVLVLQAAQPLVGVGDAVERLQHFRLQLGLDRGERERIFEIVLVEVAFADRLFAADGFSAVAVNGLGLERSRRGGRSRGRRHLRRLARHDGGGRWRILAVDAGRGIAAHGGRHRLGVRPGIGRFKVDDVAQEHLAVVQLVAPDDDGLEGERALTQPRDHRLAAGLDALGNGDFALAREKLDRAHFAQIHAHGVVGALARLGFLGLGRRLLLNFDEFAVALLFLGLLARLALLGVVLFRFDDVDAHLVEHREHVLDLIGGHFLGRQNRVDLFMRDIAALLRELDHLADFGVRQIKQRQRRVGGPLWRLLLRRLLGLLRRGGFGRSLDRPLLGGLGRELGQDFGRRLCRRLGRYLGGRLRGGLGGRLMRRFGGLRGGLGRRSCLCHHQHLLSGRAARAPPPRGAASSSIIIEAAATAPPRIGSAVSPGRLKPRLTLSSAVLARYPTF